MSLGFLQRRCNRYNPRKTRNLYKYHTEILFQIILAQAVLFRTQSFSGPLPQKNTDAPAGIRGCVTHKSVCALVSNRKKDNSGDL